MMTHIINGLCLKRVQNIAVDVDIIIKEHNSFVPKLFLGLMCIKTTKTLRGLPRIHTT